MREATRRLLADGTDKFIGFASDSPTVGHIQHLAGLEANVIYSDIDPVMVEHGRKILEDNDGVRLLRCDAAKPEELVTTSTIF